MESFGLNIEDLVKAITEEISLLELFMTIRPEILKYQLAHKERGTSIPLSIYGELKKPLEVEKKFVLRLLDFMSDDKERGAFSSYLTNILMMLEDVHFESSKVEDIVSYIAESNLKSDFSSESLEKLRRTLLND